MHKILYKTNTQHIFICGQSEQTRGREKETYNVAEEDAQKKIGNEWDDRKTKQHVVQDRCLSPLKYFYVVVVAATAHDM